MPPSPIADRARRIAIQSHRYLGYLVEGGPAWAVMFVTSRFRRVRSLAARGSAGPEPVSAGTRFPETAIEAVVEALRRDGASMGIQLGADDVAELTRYGDRASGPPGASVVHLDEPLTLTTACPLVGRLERDPVLVEIARRYLGRTPVLLGSRMWWSLAGTSSIAERTKYGQDLWHYDLHGYRSIKFSFYLTDVGPAGGTAYLAGSHEHKRLRHQATLFIGRTDAEILRLYGPEGRVVVGPAGTGFALDPYTFHRGTPPGRDRLMLQIEFGLRRYLRNCYAFATPLPRTLR